MINKELIKPYEDRYEEYLGDESKMKGTASSISFPKTKEDVITIIKSVSYSSTPITIQGGKTGICGGAVPLEGHIMNLSHMNEVVDYEIIDKKHYIKVQPGITLTELDKELYKKNLMWPPQPTETSATVGGIVATNAQGINSYLYGDTYKYIEKIDFIDFSGELYTIKRGQYLFNDNSCVLPNGEVLTLYTSILGMKHNQDLIDVIIGSEGMFGVVVECTLQVTERPQEIWGIAFFFDSKKDIFDFAEKVKNSIIDEGTASIAAFEYIDKKSLKYIKELKEVATKLKELPHIDEETMGMIYIEIYGEEEDDIESIAGQLMELAIEFNSDPDNAWAVSGEEEIEKLRTFRHAAAEAINVTVEKSRQLDERITKLGTDMSLEGKEFRDVIKKYEKDAKDEGLEVAVFGHIADNHLHVNIISRNFEDYEKGKKLFEKWALEIIKNGGNVFNEHGIGKLKKELFQKVIDEKVLNEIKGLKKQLDPKGIWNPGNKIDL